MRVTVIDGKTVKFKDCDGCPFFREDEWGFFCQYPREGGRVAHMSAIEWNVPNTDKYCPLKEVEE